MEQYEKIAVMGLGSTGRSAVEGMKKRGMDGVKFISIKDGDSSLPVADSLAGTDMLFLVASPVKEGITEAITYANIAREIGVLTFGIALIPQAYDREKTKWFKDSVDAVMLSLDYEEAGRVVEFISDLINKAGFINLEFSDIKSILSNAGYVCAGAGVGIGEKRLEQAARDALRSLSEYAVTENVEGMIMGITSGPDVTLMELADAAEIIKGTVNPGARVVWAHIIDETAGESLRVNLLAAISPTSSFRNYYFGYSEMLRHESVEELAQRLDNGLDVYQKDTSPRGGGRTFFEAAIRWGNPEVVKLCLEKGADPDFADPTGKPGSAMSAAIYEKNLETLRALIEAGADLGHLSVHEIWDYCALHTRSAERDGARGKTHFKVRILF